MSYYKVLFFVLLLTSLHIKADQEQVPASFRLTALDSGYDISSTNFPTGPTVIQFWGSWCTGCKGTWRELEQTLQKHFDGNVNLLVVSIDPDKASASLRSKEFRQNSFTMGRILYDDGGKLHEALKVDSVPTILVLDEQLAVRTMLRGHPDAAMRKDLVATINSIK